jgi:hypothetical protein
VTNTVDKKLAPHRLLIWPSRSAQDAPQTDDNDIDCHSTLTFTTRCSLAHLPLHPPSTSPPPSLTPCKPHDGPPSPKMRNHPPPHLRIPLLQHQKLRQTYRRNRKSNLNLCTLKLRHSSQLYVPFFTPPPAPYHSLTVPKLFSTLTRYSFH